MFVRFWAPTPDIPIYSTLEPYFNALVRFAVESLSLLCLTKLPTFEFLAEIAASWASVNELFELVAVC